MLSILTLGKSYGTKILFYYKLVELLSSLNREILDIEGPNNFISDVFICWYLEENRIIKIIIYQLTYIFIYIFMYNSHILITLWIITKYFYNFIKNNDEWTQMHMCYQ